MAHRVTSALIPQCSNQDPFLRSRFPEELLLRIRELLNPKENTTFSMTCKALSAYHVYSEIIERNLLEPILQKRLGMPFPITDALAALAIHRLGQCTDLLRKVELADEVVNNERLTKFYEKYNNKNLIRLIKHLIETEQLRLPSIDIALLESGFLEEHPELFSTVFSSNHFTFMYKWILNIKPETISCIPEEFSNFKNLSILNMGGNPIGSLPSAIFTLRNLRILECPRTHLHYLSPQIGLLTNLNSLVISDNPSLRRLPKEFSQLSKLYALKANNCRFTKFPSCIPLGIATLKLASNRIREIPQVVNLPKLCRIDLRENLLTEFPTQLLLLPNRPSLFILGNLIIPKKVTKSSSN